MKKYAVLLITTFFLIACAVKVNAVEPRWVDYHHEEGIGAFYIDQNSIQKYADTPHWRTLVWGANKISADETGAISAQMSITLDCKSGMAKINDVPHSYELPYGQGKIVEVLDAQDGEFQVLDAVFAPDALFELICTQ